jgi:hypothetical protein
VDHEDRSAQVFFQATAESRRLSLTPARDDQKTGGLVEDDEMLVLEEDVHDPFHVPLYRLRSTGYITPVDANNGRKKSVKKIGSVLISAWALLYPRALLFAQDTTPRGPSQWTAKNWVGFFLYIGLFILAVIGIYKLAGVDEITENEKK